MTWALYATMPPSPDQFAFDYLAWRISEGEVLYSDLVDTNWPGGIWLHMLAREALGHHWYSWRILDFGLMLFCVGFLADLLRRVLGTLAAGWLLVLYPVLYVAATGAWFAGQRDITGTHILFIALWAHWRGCETRLLAWQALAGVAVGFATLVKPTLVLGGMVLLADSVLFGAVAARRGFRTRLAQGATLVSGCLACLLGGLLWICASGATLREFWNAAVFYHLAHIQGDRVATQGATIWRCYARDWNWIAVGAAVGAVGVLLRPQGPGRRLLGVLVGFWLAGVVSFVVQGRAFRYHLGPSFAATAVVLCLGTALAHGACRGSGRRGVRYGALAAILLVIAGSVVKVGNSCGSAIRLALGRTGIEEHLVSFPGGGGLNVAEVFQLAAMLRTRGSHDAERTALVWEPASGVSYLSRRPQPTRFYLPSILTDLDPDTRLARAWRRLLREDLRNRPPDVVVIDDGHVDGFIGLTRLPLRTDFALLASHGTARVYARFATD